MKYYDRCKLTVKVPESGDFDEAAVRDALSEALPGIEVEFLRSAAAQMLESAEAFVPDSHPLAGMTEQDFQTKKTVLVGPRNILLAAEDVLQRINYPEA